MWFAGPGGVSVNVVSEGDKQAWPSAGQRQLFPFALYTDDNGKTLANMGGRFVPYLVLADERSVVRFVHTGELDVGSLASLIKAFYTDGTANEPGTLRK
jgi:hypothetical protein